MAHEGSTRHTILEVADDLFASRGYDAVSIRNIAASAGVAKAAVFYHFATKDDLHAAVLERYYRAHETALAEAHAPGDDLAESLHRLLDAYLDFASDNVRYMRMVQRMVAGGGGDLAVVEGNLGVLLGAIEQAIAPITPADGPLAARQFFVTLSGAVINYFTYAPALAAAWGQDPLGEAAVGERRAHLHWLVDVLLEGLESTVAPA